MAESPPDSAPLILVIDDVEDNRDVYTQFLTHQGWRVATAVDGEDGLTKAAAVQPSVIILDLGLPRMDGWEVALRLRNTPATSEIPIIALTGHVTRESRQRALTAGVNEFCAKPCLPMDLIAAIRRNLE